MNTKLLASILLLPASLFLQGCLHENSPRQADTLIVDLAAVARAIGEDKAVNAALAQARSQLESQLNELANRLNSELDQAKQPPKKPSDKKRPDDYTRLTEAAATKLRQSRRVAQQQLNTMQARLLNTFRERVRDVAAQIVRQRGASQVQASGPELLWFDPSTDITGEVISRLRAQADIPRSSDTTATDPATRIETEKLNQLVDTVKNTP